MNPGGDIGKKELPLNIRSKFTEIFVHDITEKKDILVNFNIIFEKFNKFII